MNRLATRGEARASLWLWASVFVTCGALAACVVLAPTSGGSPDVGLAWLLFVGSSVHVASTGWLFTNPAIRRFAWQRRGRYVWAPVGLVAGGILLSATVSPRVMAWAVLLLLAWQLHHFQKQNLGQVALVGASLGLGSLRRGERAAICTTGAAGIGGVCAHPALLQLDVRPPLGGYLALLATALLVVGVARWNAGVDQAAEVRPASEVLRDVRVGAPLSAPDLPVHLAVRSHRRHDDGARSPIPASARSRGGWKPSPAPDRRRGCALRAGGPGRSGAECDFSSARRGPATAAVLRGLCGPPRGPLRRRCGHLASP